MKRVSLVLALFLLAPFLMGGGGQLGTPVPASFVPNGDAVNALITIDTHEPSASPTAKVGYITITDRHGRNAQTTFLVPDDFPFFLGCAPSQTQSRFVINGGNRVRIQGWMDSDVATALFAQLGIAADQSANIPALTQVLNGSGGGVCTSPRAGFDGWLFVQGVIEVFSAPKK